VRKSCPAPGHKAYRRSRGKVPLILTLGPGYFAPGQDPGYPFNKRLAGPRLVWMIWRGEKIYSQYS